MEFRDAVKYLRSELGLTQVELATALNMNAVTIGRWENGKTLPPRSISAVLSEYARTKGASDECLEILNKAISNAVKDKLDFSGESLYAVEHASLRQLIDEAYFPVYVCDIETDELLYVNRKAEKMIGSDKPAAGKKCYACLMHRDTPCPFCHKNELEPGCLKTYSAFRELDGTTYRVQGRLIQWNGRKAQVRYVFAMSKAVNTGITSTDTGKFFDAIAQGADGVENMMLRAIMSSVSSGITACEYKDDGSVNYIFVSEKYYELLGFTREQFSQEVTDPFGLVYSEDADSVREQAMALVTPGQTVTLQFRAVRRDGKIIWLKDNITLMNFDNPAYPVQLSVFTDITEIVEAEKIQKMNLDKVVEMVNAAPSGIEVIEVNPSDIAGTFHTIYYNDRFYSYSGCTREEYASILKQDELFFTYPEDTDVFIAAVKSICKHDIGFSEEWEARCRTKTGGYRWLQLTGQLFSKQDNLYTITISNVDITGRKKFEDKQRVSEEMLRIAAETDHRALITYDVKANTCHVESRTLYAGHFGETIKDIPKTLIDRKIAAPDSAADLCSMFGRIRSGEKRVTVSLQMNTGKNEYQWFECNASTVFDADGNPDHAVLVFHNISEQRIKEAVYKKWQQSITSRSPETFTLFRCNLSKDALLDQRDGELLKIAFYSESLTFNERTREYAEQYVFEDDRKDYTALLNSDVLLAMYYRGEHAATMDYRETAENGELLWRRLTVELVEYLNSSDVQAFLLYEDIDEAKKAELKAKELADSDPLTGALNRNAFFEKVDILIQGEPTVQHAMLMIDMDGFKQVNDTLGHDVGDQELMNVTAVVRSLLRPVDLVCRLGGDEFLIWLNAVDYSAVIEKKARQICEQLTRIYDNYVVITASIGIAVYPRDGHDSKSLYTSSDRALYKVKNSGKNGFAFYSAGDGNEASHAESHSVHKSVTEQSKLSKRRMLIVDDNEANREMLKNLFRDEFLIESAKNGNDALIQLRHFGSAISIVLLDLRMPGISGFEVLKRMQSSAETRTVPVIIVSVDDDYETSLQAIEAGAADYVTKPVDPNLIRVRVRSAISKSENERLRAQNSYLMLQREEELKFQTVLQSTGTVIVEYNWRTHVFIYDNTISRYIAGDYNNRPLWRVFLSDMVADSNDVKMLQEALLTLANDRKSNNISKLVLLKTPAGVKHWFRMNAYKQTDDFGLADKLIITFNDVHDEAVTNEKLLYQTTHDELTGLYNRSGFISKAAEMIAAKPVDYYVIASVDIAKFKVINDQYGTLKGDEVLCKVAGVLKRLHDSKDSICCRVMADCFAILYPQSLIDSPELAYSHHAVEVLDGSLPPLSIAIGRCLVNDKELDVSAYYDRAMLAKETIKGRYDAYVATYDESMRTSLLRRQEITGQMKQALAEGQFEVWLQAQFNHSTGLLSGAEALVRWRHPKEGIISPAEFIPVFEENGFVYEVDKYVWETTCKLLRKWLDSGLKPVPVSVNISRYDLFRSDLIDVVTGLVNKYGLPAGMLRLEITESAFSESAEQIISVVKGFIELGFTVEIDDFGSGYSSLNTLKDVPAQVLKMDMRFLENDTNAQRGGSIVESVIRMAKWLGMSVIAEGVETVEQADYLKSIGCEYVQGYLYARPTKTEEYEQLFTDGKTESHPDKLKAVDTWNNNAFWNPGSMETLVFNNYVGGACIFEMTGDSAELLRYNKGYAKIFGRHSDFDYSDAHKNIFTVLNTDNAECLRHCISTAVKTKTEASCELEIANKTNTTVMFLIATVRQIAEAGERKLFYCVVNDITEQRMAEQKRLEAERKQSESARTLEVVMNNINGGVSAIQIFEDGTSQPVFNNEKYYELYGYTKAQAEAAHLNVLDGILREDLDGVLAAVRQMKETGVPAVIDYRIQKPNGKLAYIRANSSLINMSGYGKDIIASVLTDITEQRKLSEQLQTLVENISGGVTATVIKDGEPEFLVVNSKFYKMLGYETREEFSASCGDDKYANLHPDDRERIVRQFETADGGKTEYTMEYRVIRKDGSVGYVQNNIRVIQMFGIDEPVQLSVANDMTDFRTVQMKERNAASQLTAIMANIQGGITATVLHDNDNLELIFANEGFYELLGYTKAQWETEVSDMLDLILPEDREHTIKTVAHIVQTRDSETYEYRCRKRDGSIIWIQTTDSVISLGGVSDTVLLAVTTNTTAQKNAFDKLRYLSDTAHEILKQTDADRAIEDTLRKLLTYHQADRGYIVELDHDKMVSHNTYEICTDGVTAEKKNLQELPFSKSDFWYDTLSQEKFLYIDDISAMEDDRSEVRTLLSAQGIRSLLIAPLFNGDGLIGFAGVDNPRINLGESEHLSAMRDYLSILLDRRNMEDMRKKLLDNLSCGVALYEFDGVHISVIHINASYWKLIGRDPVDYTKAEVTDVVHPADRSVLIQEMVACIHQHRNFSCDFRVINGEGVYMPFHVSATVTQKAGGTYLFYATYTPISSVAMSIQEMLPIVLSTVMNTSEDISFIKDSDGRYISCSKTAIDAFGLDNGQDIIGKTNIEVFGNGVSEKLILEDKQIIESGIPVIDRMIRLPVRGGDTCVYCMSKYPLLDGNGKVVGIYCICRDVTAAKANEFELTTLLRVMPTGIIKCAATEDGEFAYINQNFINALGYTDEQFRVRFRNRFRDMVWTDNDKDDYPSLEASASEGRINRADIRIEAADGQLRWFHVEGVRVIDENGKAWYYVTLVDVTDRKNAEDKLQLVLNENHLAIEHSGNIITRFDVENRTLTMPENLSPIFNLPSILHNVPQAQIELGRISPETADAYTELFESITRGKASGTAVYQQKSTNGWLWLKAQFTTVFDSSGKPVSAVISFTDVTETLEKEVVYTKWQQSIEERPKDSYALFRCNLNRNASYDVWEGNLLSVKFGDTLYSFNENTAAFTAQCVYEDDRKKYLNFVNSDKMLAEYYRNHRSDSLEFRGILPDGTISWLKLTVDLVEAHQSKEIEAFLLYENIDEQKKTELESQHMAETDPLTGLLNRQAFSARVNELIRNSKPYMQHAFFMLDLDGFKMLNDTFGHAAGDDALADVAHKLQKMLRKDDVLARLGGDEFVIFLSNISGEEGIAEKAKQINKEILKAYSTEVQISASIGIALYPRDGSDSHELYEKADIALYAAKEAGRNTFRQYSLSLPDKGAGADSHEMGAEHTESANVPAKIRLMLIVDDSRTEILLLKKIFEKEYNVDVALDGASALTRMRHYGSALSVVLLDLNMVGMSGFDVLDKAQKSPEMHGIPIIIVSGEDDKDTCMRAIRSGATDYISKPVQPELIRLRVSAAISRAENERLRAQNSYLRLRENETTRYQTALNGMGMFVVELDWINGSFIYDSTISQYLKGTFDNRTLWRILLSDMVASAADVRALQDSLHKLANDHDRTGDSIEITLATPSKKKHRFKLITKKLLSDIGITQKFIITFRDLEI